MTLLACEMSAIVRQFEHSLALPFFVGLPLPKPLLLRFANWLALLASPLISEGPV